MRPPKQNQSGVLDRRIRCGGTLVERPRPRPGSIVLRRLPFDPAPSRPHRREFAKLYVADKKLAVELDVVKVEAGSVRYFRPNGSHLRTRRRTCRHLTAAILYPGIGILKRRISVWVAGPNGRSNGSAPRARRAKTRGHPDEQGLPRRAIRSSESNTGWLRSQDKLCGGVDILVTIGRNSVPSTSAWSWRRHCEPFTRKSGIRSGTIRLLIHKATFEGLVAEECRRAGKGWQPDTEKYLVRREGDSSVSVGWARGPRFSSTIARHGGPAGPPTEPVTHAERIRGRIRHYEPHSRAIPCMPVRGVSGLSCTPTACSSLPGGDIEQYSMLAGNLRQQGDAQ